jgi:hypothetical protein
MQGEAGLGHIEEEMEMEAVAGPSKKRPAAAAAKAAPPAKAARARTPSTPTPKVSGPPVSTSARSSRVAAEDERGEGGADEEEEESGLGGAGGEEEEEEEEAEEMQGRGGGGWIFEGEDDEEGVDGLDSEVNDAGGTLCAAEVAEVQTLMAMLDGEGAAEEPGCRHLRPAPTGTIEDLFSLVLTDGWHMLDRVKVKVHHSSKKAYYHALMLAYFAYDPVTLKVAVDALREKGLSNAEIEYMMYFNAGWFNKCVKRCVLPASQLYWRVRAVYAMYGPKLDANDKTPLFNEAGKP